MNYGINYDKSSSTVSHNLEDTSVVIPERKCALSDDKIEELRGNVDPSATSDTFGMDIHLSVLHYCKIILDAQN